MSNTFTGDYNAGETRFRRRGTTTSAPPRRRSVAARRHRPFRRLLFLSVCTDLYPIDFARGLPSTGRLHARRAANIHLFRPFSVVLFPKHGKKTLVIPDSALFFYLYFKKMKTDDILPD